MIVCQTIDRTIDRNQDNDRVDAELICSTGRNLVRRHRRRKVLQAKRCFLPAFETLRSLRVRDLERVIGCRDCERTAATKSDDAYFCVRRDVSRCADYLCAMFCF